MKVTHDKESASSQGSPGRNVGVTPNRSPPMTPDEWKKWCKKHERQKDDLKKAQLKMYERYKYLGVAILETDLTKTLGTLILPEIHIKISENYAETKGVHILARAPTWEEAFKSIGVQW